jgi:tetratricopeptide (TPR) repeat protein
MGNSSFLNLRQDIDALIVNYRVEEARSRLANLWIDSVPEDLRADFAQLCRRVSLHRLALKFIHKVIHESGKPSRKDMIEYAGCLRQVGLLNEAGRLLERIEPGTDSLMQQAFCYTHGWDYAQAANILLQVLARPNLSERESRIARVNLVSSLNVLNQFEASQQWLRELASECQKHHPHLYVNCLELQAQIHHAQGDLAAASETLDDAEKHSPQQPGHSGILIEKWRHIVALTDEVTPERLKAFENFKQRVRSLHHWESLRSLDWELARALHNGDLATQVFFGTPYNGFRRQILTSEFGENLPWAYFRADARWQGARGKIINPMTGENMPFKFGSLQYRATMLLMSDNYRPWTVYRMFDGLFGEEAFNPFSSPKRIYQMVERIRDEVIKDGLPMELKTVGKGFRLRPCGDGVIVVLDRMNFGASEDLVGQVIAYQFNDKPFTLSDLKKLLPLSTDQTSRTVRKLIRSKVLEPAGNRSKAPAYRLKAS